MPTPFDLLIRHGTLLDGTGAPPRIADLGIRSERIEALGDLAQATGRLELDAAGLTVTPGFIDAHSHSDAYLLVAPDAPSKVSQGVTTEIVGQCGASAAPLPGHARLAADWEAMLRAAGVIAAHVPAGAPPWRTVADFRARLAQAGHAPNVVLLVGHNTLRSGVMGHAPETASAESCRAMARSLEQALDEGASGLSTGLIYSPGRHATPEEVQALAQVVARRGGVYASHLRSEGAGLLEALDEVLAVGRATGVAVQVSHLKTSGRANWHKLDDALARLNGARQAGLRVHADRYPYLASGTDLDVILPEWAATGGREAILARLADPAMRTRIVTELDAGRTPEDWTRIMVGAVWHATTRRFAGWTLNRVADELHCGTGEAVTRLLVADELKTGAFFFGMSEENLRRIYAQPWVMVGSDASVRSPVGPLATDHPHPRAYGTFPRFLRLVLDGGVLSLPEAVRRATALPAAAFGLTGRGHLAPGAFADLAILDLSRVGDRATFAQPHQHAEGICWTVVNGQVVWADGACTNARPGRILQARV